MKRSYRNRESRMAATVHQICEHGKELKILLEKFIFLQKIGMTYADMQNRMYVIPIFV